VELDVGDVVVYGTHGIGRVSARKKLVVSDQRHDVVVLELEEGLTVTLPIARAREQLRTLASEADIREVQATLRAERVLSEQPWLARRREMQSKLTGGHPVELAEIVEEGAQRQRALSVKGKTSQLSAGEKELFTRARQLLSGEIAQARGLQQEEADAWIEEQLSRTG
jgi:CarD family transcriptional regulator